MDQRGKKFYKITLFFNMYPWLHELENTRLKMSNKTLAEGRLKEIIALISDPRRRN